MINTLHLVLKFQNITSIIVHGKKTNTITEHKQLCNSQNRLIWGQGSKRKSSGVAEKNRNRLKQQIENGINTYSFFLANNNGEKELYVGKMINIYDRGEISHNSPLSRFIPSYYAFKIGTSNDDSNLFVDVTTFFKIEKKYLDYITVESTGNKILTVTNSSSIFLVNIDEKLQRVLIELLNDPEINFQHEVEQEDIPDSIAVVDQPKDKSYKTTNSNSSYYKRNSKTAKTAIVTAKYQCEIDSSHKDFISKVTAKNYVEAHHLIPMEYQDEFDNSIDIEANIVSLCVGCHKKLHHGTYSVIKPLIEKLYDDRIDRLRRCSIELTKDKLLRYYI
jgi:5-methylcytosine-specific restriction protein A